MSSSLESCGTRESTTETKGVLLKRARCLAKQAAELSGGADSGPREYFYGASNFNPEIPSFTPANASSTTSSPAVNIQSQASPSTPPPKSKLNPESKAFVPLKSSTLNVGAATFIPPPRPLVVAPPQGDVEAVATEKITGSGPREFYYGTNNFNPEIPSFTPANASSTTSSPAMANSTQAPASPLTPAKSKLNLESKAVVPNSPSSPSQFKTDSSPREYYYGASNFNPEIPSFTPASPFTPAKSKLNPESKAFVPNSPSPPSQFKTSALNVGAVIPPSLVVAPPWGDVRATTEVVTQSIAHSKGSYVGMATGFPYQNRGGL